MIRLSTMIRLGDFSLPGEALTGLEAIRSVSDLGIIKSFKERRSPGWRWEDPSLHHDPSLHNDPSRGFLAPRRGAHRAGGNKIRLGPGN